MLKYLRNTLLTLLVLVLILAGFMVKTFYDAGEFREIKSHFKGQSKSVSGVLSSEDITIHPRTGLAFISSADRRAQVSDAAQPRQGAIYGFDLSSANSQLVNLTVGFDKEFNPHGIGLWMAGDGTSSLFVVNHRRDGHFVEYSKDPGVLSPSQVIKVTIKESGQHTVKEIYLSHGQPLSGSSVAAVFENTLLIGSVFDEHFLLCNLQN